MDFLKFASENARREFGLDPRQPMTVPCSDCGQAIAGENAADCVINLAVHKRAHAAFTDYREYLTSELDPRD